MKKVLPLIISYIFFASNCSGQKEINLLNYPIDDLEGIVATQYSGVYRNFDFKYMNGAALFYLVPKDIPSQWLKIQFAQINGNNDSEKEDILLKNLNNKSFREISKDFNIYVFHTDKKYLIKTPMMDSPYTPIIPRTVHLYQLIFNKNEIERLDSLTINTFQDESKEIIWMNNFITDLIKNKEGIK